MTRRRLLGTAAVAAAFTIVPRRVLGGQGNTTPSGKVNVALRAGKKLDFDWKNMKITNVPEANQFLKPNYREGRSI